MRGSPLLRTILVLIVLILAAVPVWKLTRPAIVAVVAEDSTPASKAGVRIGLTFANAPLDFQLLHLGKVIWEGKSPGATASKDFEMEFPKEGIDLEIKAGWPSGTTISAVRVTVTVGNGTALERSAWGTGSVDEVLTFREPE